MVRPEVEMAYLRLFPGAVIKGKKVRTVTERKLLLRILIRAMFAFFY